MYLGKKYSTRKQCLSIIKNSTIHGLPRAANASNRTAAVFWVTVFLLGLGALCVNLGLIVHKYFSKPILTTYYSRSEPIVWPEFTLCSSVPVNLRDEHSYELWRKILLKAKQYRRHEHWDNAANLSIQIVNKSKDFDVNEGYLYSIELDKSKNLSDMIVHTLSLSSINPYDFYFHNPRMHIISESFSRGIVNIATTIEPGGSIWESFDDPLSLYTPRSLYYRYRIPCQTFKIKNPPNSSFDKIDSIYFAVYLDNGSYKRYNSDFSKFGADLYMHSPNTFPTDQPLPIAPGFRSTIKFDQVRTQYFQEARNCRIAHDHRPIYNSMLDAEEIVDVDHEVCKLLLSQELYFRACDCFTPFLPIPKLYDTRGAPRLCYNMSVFNVQQIASNDKCLSRVFKSHENNFTDLVQLKCSHLEQRLCSDISYHFGSRVEMWTEVWSPELLSASRVEHMKRISQLMQNEVDLNNKYAQALNKNITLQEATSFLKSEIALVFIKAESINGNVVKETSEYPLSQMASDIGGVMGLYLGISLIGFVEVLQLLLCLMYGTIHNIHSRACCSDKSKVEQDVKYRKVHYPCSNVTVVSNSKSNSTFVSNNGVKTEIQVHI